MAGIQCGKEILCVVMEAAAASSKYSEYMTDEEIRACNMDAERYQDFRLELAARADKADQARQKRLSTIDNDPEFLRPQ